MNQPTPTIRLRDFIEDDVAWGREEAAEVYPKLLRAVQKIPGADVIKISAEGIKRTDASFPRETVFAVAKRHRGSTIFFVVDLATESMADNWDMAGDKLEQGVVWWKDRNTYQFLGPAPSDSLRELFELAVKSEDGIGAAEAAKRLKKSITNASTLLKQLVDKGYLARRALNSPSGGVEYRYFGPK